jgi:hypothetical protein
MRNTVGLLAEKVAMLQLTLTADDAGDDVASCVEEEELFKISRAQSLRIRHAYFGDDEGFDKHDDAASNDRCQSNDVHNAEDIKNDVARTGKLFNREKGHFGFKVIGDAGEAGRNGIDTLEELAGSCKSRVKR